MPAKSKSQQRAMAIALAAKRGDIPKSKLRGASAQMAASMSAPQLEDFASTKRKGLPERVGKTTHQSPEMLQVEHKAPGAHKKIVNVKLG